MVKTFQTQNRKKAESTTEKHPPNRNTDSLTIKPSPESTREDFLKMHK